MRASTSASAWISRSRQLSARLPSAPCIWRSAWRALAFGLGHHQVGEALDRGEIELAVLEGAAGELAGLGRAQALDACRARRGWRRSPRGRRAAAARPTSSPVSLRGAGKPQRQGLVDDGFGLRVADAGEGGLARGGEVFAGERFQRLAGARPGNAHDRDRRRRPAGGEGEDGGAVGPMDSR